MWVTEQQHWIPQTRKEKISLQQYAAKTWRVWMCNIVHVKCFFSPRRCKVKRHVGLYAFNAFLQMPLQTSVIMSLMIDDCILWIWKAMVCYHWAYVYVFLLLKHAGKQRQPCYSRDERNEQACSRIIHKETFIRVIYEDGANLLYSFGTEWCRDDWTLVKGVSVCQKHSRTFYFPSVIRSSVSAPLWSTCCCWQAAQV